MRKSYSRIDSDVTITKSENFIDTCRGGKKNVFVRLRKLSVQNLVYSLIVRRGLTIKMEMRGFMKIANPGVTISKPGYLKQRMKLNPAALEKLFKFHNKNFYSDPETEKYTLNGYLVLAADGSSVNIPTTPETLTRYGRALRRNEKTGAQMGIAGLYDVLNRMVVELSCHRSKFNEMAAAEAQIMKVRETIGEDIPFMVVMDRGYPSIPAIMRMIDAEIKFVIRLSSIDFKREQLGMESDDEDTDVLLTPGRRSRYKGTKYEELMTSRDSFPLRMVRVWLDAPRKNGEESYEILATNLSRDEFPVECFREIYHMRWRIETAFQVLKDRLQLENFTGTKPVLLEQDVYSTVYVSNVCEDVARDIEHEQAERLKNDYKHRMAVNRSLCIGILKNDLIYILLEKDPRVKEELFHRMYNEISENIVPVRPDRHYERTKRNVTGKYSNTHKRSY